METNLSSWLRKILILSVFVLPLIFSGCKKEPLKIAPTVTMSSVTNITSVSATAGVNVSSVGGY
jgi:hypothetical protein